MAKAKPLTDDEGEVRELTLEDLKRFRPASEILSPSLLEKLSARPARAPVEGSASGIRRGTNARLVEEVLQEIAPRAVRPAEIRNALQRKKGVRMAFASVRHALEQLEARHAVEQVIESKTWRFRRDASAPITVKSEANDG
jgi:hypothetical protein